MWNSAKKEPDEAGVYSCIVEFYKEPFDIQVINAEYYGEWKINETWNLLLWKRRILESRLGM